MPDIRSFRSLMMAVVLIATSCTATGLAASVEPGYSGDRWTLLDPASIRKSTHSDAKVQGGVIWRDPLKADGKAGWIIDGSPSSAKGLLPIPEAPDAQSVIALYCQFSGSPDPAPSIIEKMTSLLTDVDTGVLPWFQRQSSGRMLQTLDGVAVTQLPLTRDAYNNAQTGRGILIEAVTDCIDGSGLEQAYRAGQIVAFFSDRFEPGLTASYGGHLVYLLTPSNTSYRTSVAWIAATMHSPAVVAHEMGHGLGLPHSDNNDLDQDPYDNPFDIMSGPEGGVCMAGFWCLPQAMHPWHRYRLGWIDDVRIAHLFPDEDSHLVWLGPGEEAVELVIAYNDQQQFYPVTLDSYDALTVHWVSPWAHPGDAGRLRVPAVFLNHRSINRENYLNLIDASGANYSSGPGAYYTQDEWSVQSGYRYPFGTPYDYGQPFTLDVIFLAPWGALVEITFGTPPIVFRDGMETSP